MYRTRLTRDSLRAEKTIEIFYRDKKIGEHRLDLLVSHNLVVELKAVKEIEAIHFTAVRSYVKATNATSGIILNFSTMPLTIKRVGVENTYLPS